MARIELKGTFLAVLPVVQVGEKGTLKQTIIFETKAWRDEFGETKGEDEQWSIDLLGEQISKLNISNTAVGRKATVTVYVNSRKYEQKDAKGKALGTFIYPVSLKLGKVEFAEVKQTA